MQKEIEAQVSITQAFGQQAGKAVSDYVQAERSALREKLKNATSDSEKTEVRKQLSDLALQERVMNVLVGAVTGMGGSALTKEALSEAADQLRRLTIENSKLFAGVTDGVTVLSNLSGESEGVRADDVKTGGTRVDPDLLCGTDNRRCKTYIDEYGVTQLKLNDKGQVQFDTEAAGMSLAQFLKETAEGKKMAAPTGGIQGWKGTLFDVPYLPGSWQDKLIEAFGGPHDMMGGQWSGLYDEQGNIKRGMTGAERTARNVWSGIAIAPSTPFAMAELLPPEVWKAISILLKAAK